MSSFLLRKARSNAVETDLGCDQRIIGFVFDIFIGSRDRVCVNKDGIQVRFLTFRWLSITHLASPPMNSREQPKPHPIRALIEHAIRV